jgi:hypothetical protein
MKRTAGDNEHREFIETNELYIKRCSVLLIIKEMQIKINKVIIYFLS